MTSSIERYAARNQTPTEPKNLWRVLLVLPALLCFGLPVSAGTIQRAQVADPFLEMRSGPGDGFPIFHIVERHEWIEIIKRKTDWIKVRTVDGKLGWTFIDQMENTLIAPGKRLGLGESDKTLFQQRKWYLGTMAGDFAGATAQSFQIGWNFTETMSTEIYVTSVSGNFTNSRIWGINVLSTPFPDWTISPFFVIGGGEIKNKPRQSFVFSDETKDGMANAGFGVRYHITRRAYLRAEIKDYIVLIGDQNSGNFRETKFGFSFFF